MKAIDSLRKQFHFLLKDTGLVDEGFSASNKWSNDENLIRAVICTGLYPGVCSVMVSSLSNICVNFTHRFHSCRKIIEFSRKHIPAKSFILLCTLQNVLFTYLNL